MFARPASPFPLLRLELVRQAQRRTTYVVRLLIAVLMLLIVSGLVTAAVNSTVALASVVQTSTPGIFRSMGVGGQVYREVVPLLFLSIPVLAPILCSSVITAEKEQNRLGTLLITRLSPWNIILEMLASRLVPMVTLILLVSPALGYLYANGGVDQSALMSLGYFLLCDCVLFASICLLWSAWCTSSVAAFSASYVSSFLVLFVGQLLPLTAGGRNNLDSTAAMTVSGVDLWNAVRVTGMPLVLALMLLIAARFSLLGRAFSHPSRFIIDLFGRLDLFFRTLNERTTGGIELNVTRHPLPEQDPIRWRERGRLSAGGIHWLIRVLLVVEIPILLICAAAIALPQFPQATSLYPLLATTWVAAAGVCAVKGVSLIGRERSRQTLQPLLSTPMSTAEILRQKTQGTHRLIAVVGCPIMTVTVALGFMSAEPLASQVIRLIITTFAIFIVLKTIIWVTTGIGMLFQSQGRAVTTAFLLLGAFASWPFLPVAILDSIGVEILYSETAVLLGLGPVGLVGGIESTLGPIESHQFFRLFHRLFADVGFRASYFWNGRAPMLFLLGIVSHAAYLALARTLILSFGPGMLQRKDTGDSLLAHFMTRRSHG